MDTDLSGQSPASRFVPCLNPATVTGLELVEFVRLAAAASFTAVELPIQQVVAHGPARVADLLDGHGLSAVAASGILPAGPVLPAPLLVDDAAYPAVLTGLGARLAALETIGCPVATIVLNPRTAREPQAAAVTAVARLRHLAHVAAGHGVRVAVEVIGVRRGLDPCLEGPHEVASTLPQLRGLLTRLDGEDVAVCVDSFHWAAAGADPAHLTGLAPVPIGHVQIADVPPEVPVSAWTDQMRLFPGDGTLPWPVFADALTAAGYAGPVSVELFNPALRRLPEIHIAARAHRAAAACWTSTGIAS